MALPDDARHLPPTFTHHADLPVLTSGGARATVIMGELAGVRSPAQVHSPIVGAQVELGGGATTSVPLEPDFEHALMVMAVRSGSPPVTATPTWRPARCCTSAVAAGSCG